MTRAYLTENGVEYRPDPKLSPEARRRIAERATAKFRAAAEPYRVAPSTRRCYRCHEPRENAALRYCRACRKTLEMQARRADDGRHTARIAVAVALGAVFVLAVFVLTDTLAR